MPNWKLINQTLLYDGTFDGLLTIVFDCYTTKTLPQKIASRQTYEPNFLDKPRLIQTDEAKANRIFHGIEKVIGQDALTHSFYCFLCSDANKEITILKYLCDGFEIGPKINQKLTISYVYDVIRMHRKAFGECHRLKGLLRLQEVGPNLFYGSCHPDHAILEPLGHHFMRRLPNQNLMIHDQTHHLCFITNGKTYQIIEDTHLVIPTISKQEKQFQDLWELFFKTIAIPERKNPRCQMQFMPKKYWQDLIEEP